MQTVRKTGGREELDLLWSLVNGFIYRLWSAQNSAIILAATQNGKLKTTATCSFAIDGALYTKGATDNLWDLSAEVDPTASQYRAYWLYLDDAGVASIDAGTNASTEEAALLALPEVEPTKSIIGVYVAYPSCDMSAALDIAGTTGQVYNRVPNGVPLMPLSPTFVTPSPV